jgi:hypothetical protein
MHHEDDGLPETMAGERLTEQEDRQKEETYFCRIWREPIKLLEEMKGKRNLSAFGLRRPCLLPWMQENRETKYDFSKLEEDELDQAPLMPSMQAPKKMLNVNASEFVPGLELRRSHGGFAEDGSGTGIVEGDDDLEADEDRNMEDDTAGDSLPCDLPEEQWLRANSDNDSDLTLWYTEQVRKWYRHAV